MKKITIKDVAKEAGVSISTVSNALNGVGSMSAETKKNILEIAERLNYVPNINGRSLKTGETRMIGFYSNSVKGPYFYDLADAMFKECEKRGYSLNIIVTYDHKTIMSHVMSRMVDGVIVYSDNCIDESELEILKKNDVKVVFIDRECIGKSISSVLFDSYQGGVDAARYLINLGHQRIGYINGVPLNYDNNNRFKGFQDTLREYGLEFKQEWLLDGFYTEELAYNSVRAFAMFNHAQMPDAFFAANDLSAVGCIKALQASGYVVPDDISVIGFDDIELAQYMNPPLTTIKTPVIRQGILAVEQLFNMIEGAEGTITRLSSELIVRNSCTRMKYSRSSKDDE